MSYWEKINSRQQVIADFEALHPFDWEIAWMSASGP
jgi:hypothetical protein